MAKRPDPYRNFNFRITLGGRVVAGFRSVEIRASVVEVAEIRAGGKRGAVRKVPGVRKTADVTLKRGIIDSNALFSWFGAVVKGKGNPRKDVEIVQLVDGRRQMVSWTLSNAWPVKFQSSDLKAAGNDVAMEALELTGESLDPA